MLQYRQIVSFSFCEKETLEHMYKIDMKMRILYLQFNENTFETIENVVQQYRHCEFVHCTG